MEHLNTGSQELVDLFKHLLMLLWWIISEIYIKLGPGGCAIMAAAITLFLMIDRKSNEMADSENAKGFGFLATVMGAILLLFAVSAVYKITSG